MGEIMTKQDKIEVLRDWVWKRNITKRDDLERVCKQYDLDWYDDILSGMEWNCCDRCGNLDDATYGFIWLDWYEWTESKEDKALQKGLEKEKYNYCALCDECIEELIKKGSK